MEDQKQPDYTTVSLPNNLVAMIDKAIEKHGYRNRPDFVREAVRRLLEDLEKKGA